MTNVNKKEQRKLFWMTFAIVTVIFWAVYIAVRESHAASLQSASASWYGPGLYGNVMGCGGTLSPGTWGIANKTMPCGTKLRVCYKRCANVTVVDRGPFVSGRDFDLTAPVASYVGLVGVKTINWWYR